MVEKIFFMMHSFAYLEKRAADLKEEGELRQ
jgi:hypothetical protein